MMKGTRFFSFIIAVTLAFNSFLPVTVYADQTTQNYTQSNFYVKG